MRFARIGKVAWLSQNNYVGSLVQIPREESNYQRHDDSLTIVEIAWYITSVKECETVI